MLKKKRDSLVNQDDKHTVVPLTTVVTVVEELTSAVPVVESEFEVDSKSAAAEVVGVGVILEKLEVVGVVEMEVGEDGVDINVDNAGVALVGVDGCSGIPSDIDILVTLSG